MLPLKKDIRLVRSLHQKKFRQEMGLFIAEGKKIVEEALHSHYSVKSVYTTDSEFAAKHKDSFLVTAKEMEQISFLTQPPGYLVVLEAKKSGILDWKKKIILALDGISDPGNMGTILRTAEWFGITEVLCSDDCVEINNPKVVQATMGSFLRVNCISGQFDKQLDDLKSNGFHLLGADLTGENIFTSEMIAPLVLVIGNESRGISEGVRSRLTKKIHIPGAGGAESLNASVAASILMAEYFRRIY